MAMHRVLCSLAFDRISMRDTDSVGRLHIEKTNICKACINPYKGSEIPGWQELGLEPDHIYQLLRPPEELEKATSSSNGIQLLRVHKPVDADDHKPWDVAGSVGTSAEWDGEYVKNALTIWPAADIDGVKSKRKMELSPGYSYKPVMEPGTFKGESYDGRMTKIEFNHLALVEEGRQGGDIVVADSAEEMQWAAIERAILALDAEFSESDHPRRDDGKFGSGSGVDPDETIKAGEIEPPHEVRDKSKLKELISSMKKNGWQGRPILVFEGVNGKEGITGSHRVAAAKKAGIDVPVVVLPQKVLEFKSEEGNFEDFDHVQRSGDDYDKKDFLKNALEWMKSQKADEEEVSALEKSISLISEEINANSDEDQ